MPTIYLTYNNSKESSLISLILTISLPLIAITEITTGISNLYRGISTPHEENQDDHSAKVLNLVKIVHGSILLSHTYNPSIYTSLFLGSYSLINGFSQAKMGGTQIKFEAIHYVNDSNQSNIAIKSCSFKNLAEGIVSFSLGMYDSYHGANRIFQELHQLQLVIKQNKSLPSHPINQPGQSTINQPEKSSSIKKLNSNKQKYPREFIELLKPETLLEIKKAGFSPDEFLQISKDLCLASDFKNGDTIVKYSKACLSNKKYPLPWFSDVVATIILRQDDPSRSIEQRIESLNSAFQMTTSLIDALKSQIKLKSLNAATILNDNFPGSFSNKFPDENFNATLLSKANVYIRRVTKNDNICDVIETIRALNGKPLDFMEFVGHGNHKAIGFGSGIRLNTNNVKEIGSCIRNALKPNKASIAIVSCFSGANQGPFLNLAERLAGETGLPVYGATQILRRTECSYPINEKDGLLELKCKKIKILDSDLEGTRMGQYITRFERTLDESDRLTIESDCNSHPKYFGCYCLPSNMTASTNFR